MIVKRNDGSTTKREKITMFAINCGIIQVLK
jgi:hypothetical protein